MIRRVLRGAGALLVFSLLATANSGGYRYGISDQAFYVPAIAKSLDASLFPRDSAVLSTQMRAWVGDDLIASAARSTGASVPLLALALYAAGLVLLGGAAVFFLRGIGASPWTVLAGLALLTLRHRIPRTGANSLEGYFHPRMFAFALGLWALGFLVRRRPIVAAAVVGLAGIAHPTTALWFGAVVIVAWLWSVDRRWPWAVAAVVIAAAAWIGAAGVRMDAQWIEAIGGKDYLFPTAWPWYAWVINLGYPVVLWAVYRRRLAWGEPRPGEAALVAGLLALTAGFLISVPLTAAHVALAVQLQITRVFWVLDAVVLLYLAWWLVEDVGGGRSFRWRPIVAAVLVAAAAARGYYTLVVETNRAFVSWTLPAGEWTAAMDFLREQSADLHVLADPGHGWKYGTSVRVAALRDTVLEQSKDTAMALYDRPLALRVVDRIQALTGFEEFSADQMRALGARYDARVLVIDNARRLPLPILYENARFVVYALR